MEQKLVLSEVHRIKELMSLVENSNGTILESVNSSGPIEKLFEKIGIKSESEFVALENKVATGAATMEEKEGYELMKNTLNRTGKTVDEILSNPAAYRAQIEDELDKIIKTNPEFGKKMLNTFLEINPAINDMLTRIDTEIIFREGQVSVVNTTKKIEALKKQIEKLTIPDYLKSLLNNKLDSNLQEIESRVAAELQRITSEVTQMIDKFSTLFLDDWENMSKVYNLKPTEKIDFDDALKSAEELTEKVIKSVGKNSNAFEEMKKLKADFEAVTPDAWFKIFDKLGKAGRWLKTNWKKIGKIGLGGIASAAAIAILLCGISTTICNVIKGTFGLFGTGAKRLVGLEDVTPSDTPPPPPPPPAAEPTPGSLAAFKKAFPDDAETAIEFKPGKIKKNNTTSVFYTWDGSKWNSDIIEE